MNSKFNFSYNRRRSSSNEKLKYQIFNYLNLSINKFIFTRFLASGTIAVC